MRLALLCAVAATAACASQEPAESASQASQASTGAPAQQTVRERRTPVTLDATFGFADRSDTVRMVGELVVALDHASAEERWLQVTAPDREQRLIVSDEGVFVWESEWRRPLWTRDDGSAGSAGFAGREGRREWSTDAEGCLHVQSLWTASTAAPSPWDSVSYDERLIWCDGAERSRELVERTSVAVVTHRWSR